MRYGSTMATQWPTLLTVSSTSKILKQQVWAVEEVSWTRGQQLEEGANYS